MATTAACARASNPACCVVIVRRRSFGFSSPLCPGSSCATVSAMRLLTLSLLGSVLLVGCHEATAADAQTAVNYRLDPQTCFDMGTPNLGVRLFLDGALRATDTLSIGEFSKPVAATPGVHTAYAQEDYSGGYVWPSTTVVVQSGQTVTVLLRC